MRTPDFDIDVPNWGHKGKKSITDGSLIWKKIRSEKRRYNNSEQKSPETAKLNKSQIKLLKNLLKL